MITLKKFAVNGPEHLCRNEYNFKKQNLLNNAYREYVFVAKKLIIILTNNTLRQHFLVKNRNVICKENYFPLMEYSVH